MMKKTIFAALALAAAGLLWLSRSRPYKTVILQKPWSTVMTSTKWKPITSGITGSSVWGPDRR